VRLSQIDVGTSSASRAGTRRDTLVHVVVDCAAGLLAGNAADLDRAGRPSLRTGRLR
jgi:hypothetical protein